MAYFLHGEIANGTTVEFGSPDRFTLPLTNRPLRWEGYQVIWLSAVLSG
jgi:hypothetical protein